MGFGNTGIRCEFRVATTSAGNAGIHPCRIKVERRVYDKGPAATKGRRNVHQSCFWIERHGRPVVGAAVGRKNRRGAPIVVVVCIGVDHRTARFRVDAAGPVDLGEGFGRNERTGHAIENVVEAVLVRLHQNPALATVNHQIGKNKALHAVVVPRITRCVLVIPFQFAGIGVDRNDRAYEKVVFTFGLTQRLGPRGRGAVQPQVQGNVQSEEELREQRIESGTQAAQDAAQEERRDANPRSDTDTDRWLRLIRLELEELTFQQRLTIRAIQESQQYTN